ncbi:hypothetical protein K431DRAFT_319301 [Polychaeton citri CBS 116435]|uniref:Rab-GAP TBC domain-containing protein n=1 Tax=Polychaeton citri CBS 116435 TaxID=1314669 RepID=A0A9P4URJ8_9PEZI|nr:hypothetical protein K431DRAFT_319301 [Polychaeton citri CBS 116435]
MSRDEDDKAHAIRAACEAEDFDALAELACSPGGLLDDGLRRTAWPILLGCKEEDEEGRHAWEHLPAHRDEAQVQLDVDRAFVYYPSNEPPDAIDARKRDLSALITAVLRSHPLLHYFQGYHDIVQVFLLVLGPPSAPATSARAVQAVTRLSLLRIRDFMLPTLSGALAQLHLLPSILASADPALYRHLSGTEPFFALAATLTLYAHDIQSYSSIARLFDFLLATEAATPLYLYVAITLSRKPELLALGPDEPEMLHFTLSKLPQPLDLEGLIASARGLLATYPPDKLPDRAWAKVSSASALKTTRPPALVRQQGLKQGEAWFHRQASEIRWQDATKRMALRSRQLALRYRRPALATSFAVAAAVLAFWVGAVI